MNRRVAVAVLVGSAGAVLGVAGAGHVYLRRWRRAAAWFAGVLGVSVALVVLLTDPQTVTPGTLPPTVVGPLVALLLASVADTYLVGRGATRTRGGDDGPSCPSCGRDVETGAEFCWYCATPFDAGDDSDATSR